MQKIAQKSLKIIKNLIKMCKKIQKVGLKSLKIIENFSTKLTDIRKKNERT